MKRHAVVVASIIGVILIETPSVTAQLGVLAGPRKLEAGGPMQGILLGTCIPVPNPMRATAATG